METTSEAPPPAKRLKFHAIRMIRGAGLLALADQCRFRLHLRQVAAGNRRFLQEHPDFRPPPADLAYDAYNYVDWARYFEGGRLHARFFAGVIARALPAEEIRILEWGCGPGRIIRHLGGLLADRAVQVTGTDYNPRTVAWCREALPDIRFELNGLMPPLALADGQYDAVYNFSVLTHLSEDVQLAWIAELLRVLRPGGVLICTTQGEGYRHMLASSRQRQQFDAGQIVVQGRYREGRKWFFALHPESYVRGTLLQPFATVERVTIQPSDGLPKDLIPQDVWLARKAATRRPGSTFPG